MDSVLTGLLDYGALGLFVVFMVYQHMTGFRTRQKQQRTSCASATTQLLASTSKTQLRFGRELRERSRRPSGGLIG